MNNFFAGPDIASNGQSFSTFVIDSNYFGTTTFVASATTGTHAIDGGNPKFANLSGGDFHLTRGSVLIAKGANLSTSFQVAKDGKIRPATGPWDIGAYEYTTAPPTPTPTRTPPPPPPQDLRIVPGP